MSTVLIFALAAMLVTALGWWYMRLRSDDGVNAILSLRNNSAMVASRAHLIDGANHIPVALSLDASSVAYANTDFDAAIDVRQIDEVEYGSDLVTGGIADGAVLRLRSHGRAFEFVLDVNAAERWSHHLPPHRMDERGRVEVV